MGVFPRYEGVGTRFLPVKAIFQLSTTFFKLSLAQNQRECANKFVYPQIGQGVTFHAG